MKQAGLNLIGKKSPREMLKNEDTVQGTGKPDGGSLKYSGE